MLQPYGGCGLLFPHQAASHVLAWCDTGIQRLQCVRTGISSPAPCGLQVLASHRLSRHRHAAKHSRQLCCLWMHLPCLLYLASDLTCCTDAAGGSLTRSSTAGLRRATPPHACSGRLRLKLATPPISGHYIKLQASMYAVWSQQVQRLCDSDISCLQCVHWQRQVSTLRASEPGSSHCSGA